MGEKVIDMTENKRFVNKGKDIFQYGEWWCSANGEHCADVIATAINELIEKNEQLKSKNKGLQSELQIFKENATHSNLQNNKLTDENEELKKEKERYKRLSEIRQQQIDNRILTIKEFINNCSDKKVRSVLKDLFYSEVKEYDLSAQNRKLLHENEQLKHNNQMLSMKMSEVYTKYCLLKEFSEDTNPNDAVKRVLSELMQITKEYR